MNSFRRNYSFLNLKTVGNSNSGLKFKFSTKIECPRPMRILGLEKKTCYAKFDPLLTQKSPTCVYVSQKPL